MNQDDKNLIFLATTGLEEFWDIKKPIVFLGDWCLRYSRQAIWKDLNYEVLPGIWRDKKKFIDAFKYLNNIYEHLLYKIAFLLDEIHKEKHDIRYWRIIIGPWLFHYIDVLYDRYVSIQEVISRYITFETIGLCEENFITPKSTLEFHLLTQDDPYNLQIYTRILSAGKYNFSHKPFEIKRKDQMILNKNIYNITKKKIIAFCLESIEKIGSKSSVYLVNPFFQKSLLIKFFLRSRGKIKPLFLSNEEIPNIKLNKSMRSYFNVISCNNNEFEKLIMQLLPHDIPYVFLEGYKMMEHKSLNYPRNPRAIMSWASWYFDELFKIWAASAAESGTSLLGVQHGGNYGIDQCMRVLDHENAITDKFYSWGWNCKELDDRIVPLPSSKVIGRKKSTKTNKNILFVGTASPRYLYRMQYPTNNHLEKYFEDQLIFLKNIDPSCKKLIRYRVFIQDYGFDIIKRIQNIYPDVVVEDWTIPFSESLENCRLFVCDHLSTVHAEALSLNVPTILFWDCDSYIHKTNACQSFENLHAIGILHYSPESAANTVNKIYDNINDWWNESERQSARLEFCNQFARNSVNSVDEWINEFKKMINSTPTDNN